MTDQALLGGPDLAPFAPSVVQIDVRSSGSALT